MALVNQDSRMSDIVIANPAIVTVLHRFGITLGLGDKTIADVCEQTHLDTTFFTTILNTYLNREYFPERLFAGFSASLIIRYLEQTNTYYEQFQLPNIERHFKPLLSMCDEPNSNLPLMHRFFSEVREAMLKRIHEDRHRWFPEVLDLERHVLTVRETSITGFDDGPDSIEDKLSDLITMFVVHLTGNYDHNLGYAVLSALDNLHKDVVQNNRIRNRILLPLAQALTQTANRL